MDTEGTYDARGTRSGSVPRPAGPPPLATRAENCLAAVVPKFTPW